MAEHEFDTGHETQMRWYKKQERRQDMDDSRAPCILVSLVQPLESLVPALPTVRIRSDIGGGGGGDGWDGGARRGCGKTGSVERGERMRGIVRARRVDGSGRRGKCGEVNGEMFSSLG